MEAAWDLKAMPHVSHYARSMLPPYLTPKDHPAFEWLQVLFGKERVTYNPQSFKDAGFVAYHPRPKARLFGYHPDHPEYVIKALADAGRQRNDTLLLRLQNATKMRKFIEDEQLEQILIPQKWAFVLPNDPEPPKAPRQEQGFVIVAERLPLCSAKETEAIFRDENTWSEAWLKELHHFFSKTQPIALSGFNFGFSEDRQRIGFFDLEQHMDLATTCQQYFAQELPGRWKDFWKDLA